MSEIVFTLVKLIVLILASLVTIYLIPWLQTSVDSKTMEKVKFWTEAAVNCAQQLMSDLDGADRKKAVESFLKRILDENHISITDEQLNTLIEAAVKQMKIAERR